MATYQGNAGNDTLTGAGENDYIYGYGGDDALDGGVGNDSLYGDTGNDTLTGGAGNDSLSGGEGNDRYIWNVGDGSDVINEYAYSGTGGADEIVFGAGVTAAQIGISINSSRDIILTYLPSGETIRLAYAADDDATAWIEQLRFADGSTVSLVNGFNSTGSSANETIYGSAFSDTLSGGDGNDYIYGGGGNDTLSGQVGNDYVYGEAGDDVITGGDGNDYLDGDAGNDSVSGGAGNDSVYGDLGDDILTGGAGNDTLSGAAGNDSYVWAIGDGSDTITDTAGTDELVFDVAVAQADVRYWYDLSGYLRVLHAPSGALISLSSQSTATYVIEQLRFLSNGAVVTPGGLTSFTGSDVGDTIAGGAGDDTLSGLGGNDALHGLAGNDTLIGGAGNDSLYGGLGDDSYLWNIGDGNDTISDYYSSTYGGGGTDTIVFGAGIALSDLAFATQSSGSDLIITHTPSGARIILDNYGDAAGQYTIEHLRLNDGTVLNFAAGFTMNGAASSETLYASNYGDRLYGMGGNDTLYAYGGNDSLYGGAGNDTLRGGGGDDTYFIVPGEGNDTIYEEGGADVLDMSSTTAGNILVLVGQYDATIRDTSTGQQIVLDNQHAQLGSVVETILLAGGATYDLTAGYVINGTDNAETIYGGLFNDTLTGLGGNDALNGNLGDDLLDGSAGNDTLNGGDGADRLFDTGGGSDALYGGAGDDKLNGGAGNDLMDGDAGAGDWAWYETETDGVVANLTTGTASGLSIGADTLVELENLFGTGAADALTGSAVANTINGAGGADQIDGGAGNDTLLGGTGNDVVGGGDGDDRLYGDEPFSPSQTTTSTGVLATGGNLAISLTGARWDPGSSTPVIGYVGTQATNASDINVVYVIDRSGSMSSQFAGDENVGDQNGDGSSNTLMDGAIASFVALHQSLIATGLGGVHVSVAQFDDQASIIFAGAANTDSDADGVYDAIEALRTLTASGGTYYDLGLQQAIQALSGEAGASNFVFFISDGAPSSNNYTDEVAILLDPLGIGADIRAIGLGDGASLPALDLVDDGLTNNTAERVQLPSQLTAGLSASTIDPSLIDRVEILVNGVIAATLAPAQLVVTPFGLQFSLTAAGLSTTAADTITARVISTGASPVTVTTAITIAQGDTSSGGDDVLSGGLGNDYIEGNGGADQLSGGDGSDTLSGGAGDDVLDGGAGSDTASYSQEFLSILAHLGWGYAGGTAIGNDTLIGIENLIGGSGNDTLLTAAGVNFASGGAGSDWIEDIVDGNDVLNGGSGIDAVLGGVGDDILHGDAGDDGVIGGAGNDTLYGDAGIDWIYGEAGDDLAYGGDDIDIIIGGDGLDTLNGGNGNDALIGEAGADLLNGEAGDDWVEGGLGNDLLNGSTGADTLIGQEGDDTVNGGAGNDGLSGGAGNDTLNGEDGDDYITGEDGADTLNGGAGNDGLFGGAGANVYNGGDGDDGLIGGGDGETMNGGAGADWLQGWGGADLLTGGAGGDSFVYTTNQDSLTTARDRILDFNRAEGDVIRLVDVDANWLVDGDQAFTVVGAFSNVAGQMTAIYNQGTNLTLLSFDMNGDSLADMAIEVIGSVTLPSDFIL
jgi:Ca2+-binding RTX toxin-like protein